MDIEIDREIILEIIGIILIEIRVHDNKGYAKTMADVAHHAPRLLNMNTNPKEIYADMLKIASRHGVEEYLEMLRKNILDKRSQS